jgi:3-hydroxy-9,10-secoandrosta-1,3,5(10)-triene-9,17-dione monooxygenase
VAHDVLEMIERSGPLFAEQSAEAEREGRLTDDVAEHLKDSGLVRLLQPADFGGYEADPRDAEGCEANCVQGRGDFRFVER